MQSFLGFASYYRQHIEIFAKITKCLYHVVKNDVVFEMTQERIEAYELLKDKLTNAPVLLHPDYEKPFKLYVDASMEGLGACQRVYVTHRNYNCDQNKKEIISFYLFIFIVFILLKILIKN